MQPWRDARAKDGKKYCMDGVEDKRSEVVPARRCGCRLSEIFTELARDTKGDVATHAFMAWLE